MKGHIIKSLRLKNNLTQEELANKIGVGKSTIAMIESGKREGSGEVSNKIADFFNVSLDFLNGKDTKVPSKESLIDKFIDDLIEEGLIEDPNNIDEEVAEMILNAVKAQAALKIKRNNR